MLSETGLCDVPITHPEESWAVTPERPGGGGRYTHTRTQNGDHLSLLTLLNKENRPKEKTNCKQMNMVQR